MQLRVKKVYKVKEVDMIMEIQSGPLVMPNSLRLPFAILAYVKNKMRKER